MRFLVSSTAVALVLAAGATAANAQTVITREIVDQPVETVTTTAPVVQTTETIRTVRPAHMRRVPREVVTTRTVTRSVVPDTTVVAGAAPVAPQPLYDQVALPPAPPPALYDAVTPAPAVGATPVVEDGLAATAPVPYQYVYEPDRILVIDPTTHIAVQALPR